MRRLFYFLLLLGIFLGLGSGCNDFLTVPSDDNLSRTDLFSTVRGADAAITGLYYLLGDPTYYQFRMPIYADLPANLQPRAEGTSNLGQLTGTQLGFESLYARDLSPALPFTGMAALYQDAYTLLFQASDIIEAIPELTEGPPEQLASLLAEARAIRAVAHFDLVRLFAQAPGFTDDASHPGIVLLDGTPGIFDQPARSTVAETYALIIADLEIAAADMDPNLSQRSGSNLWLNPAVVHGLLARAYAYTENWEACLENANSCLAATTRTLSPEDTYLDGWRMGTLNETLWTLDLQRLVNAGDEVSFQSPARIVGADNQEPFMEVSDDLFNLFADNDLRRRLFERNDDGLLLSAKWPFAINELRNIPMLRLSEVYLLRAEANLESGRLAEATQDYLTIHRRAVPTGPQPPTDVDGLRWAIRDERRLELAFEGHHFFDLGRWGADLVRNSCTEEVPECTIVYPASTFILPIPFDAILRNPNLRQNPGY